MRQIRIVLDTNILVSSAISGFGYASKIINLLADIKSFSICISEKTLEEYSAVSKYARISKKHSNYTGKMITMIELMKKVGIPCVPSFQVSILKDLSDNKFLDLAYACQADYLITGNHLDFTITEFHQTKIVSPKTFWELYESGQL